MLGYNRDLSEVIATDYPEMSRPHMCYQNVLKIVTDFPFEVDEKIEVLFCFVPNREYQYFYRHAFCLCNNEIVEPLLELGIEDINLEDIVPIKRMEPREFVVLAQKEDNYGLWKTLHNDDMKSFWKCKVSVLSNDLCAIFAYGVVWQALEEMMPGDPQPNDPQQMM